MGDDLLLLSSSSPGSVGFAGCTPFECDSLAEGPAAEVAREGSGDGSRGECVRVGGSLEARVVLGPAPLLLLRHFDYDCYFSAVVVYFFYLGEKQQPRERLRACVEDPLERRQT